MTSPHFRSANRLQPSNVPALNRRMATALCTVLCLMGSLSTTPAAEKSAAPTRGRLQLPITGIIERIESFRIPVKGRLQDTGPVVLTLDPAFRGQTVLLDFSNREVRIDTHLLIDAPLLTRLGARQTPIAVSERGKFTLRNVTPSRVKGVVTMELAYETVSRGMIKRGPLNGAAFKNKKHHCVDCCRYPANKAKLHRISVNLNAAGNVIGGTSSSALLCAADRGTLSFSGQESPFAGYRIGTLISR